MQEDVILKTIGLLGTAIGISAVLYHFVIQPIREVHKERYKRSHIIYRRQALDEEDESTPGETNGSLLTPQVPQNH